MESAALRQEHFESLWKGAETSQSTLKQRIRKLDGAAEVLFKYCSIETAHAILSSGNVILQAPDNFNDPFDCLSRVSVWHPDTRLKWRDEDLDFVRTTVGDLPPKFQFPYRIQSDLRASYSYAMSCFAPEYDSPLMWSHYASHHRGVCLGFDISAFEDDIYPCVYRDQMPDVSWQTNNVGLTLVKAGAWAYEKEWRFVRPTIRPRMRLWGQVASGLYNQIHSDSKLGHDDHVEWNDRNVAVQHALEGHYNNERAIPIPPKTMYLGLRFSHNETNVRTLQLGTELVELAAEKGMNIYQMRASKRSFALAYDPAENISAWPTGRLPPYL